MSNIAVLVNLSESTYNAMQLIFQRRYHAGLSFNTHYTLAHARSLLPTPWDWQQIEWGDSPLDIRTATCCWPTTSCRGEVADRLRAGFCRMAGQYVGLLADRAAFTVTNSSARMNTGGTDRPNLIGDPELPGRAHVHAGSTRRLRAAAAIHAWQHAGDVLHGPSQPPSVSLVQGSADRRHDRPAVPRRSSTT